MNKALFTSNYDSWETPIDLFNKLNNIFHFDLDAAASDNNHLLENYFTKENNALDQSWCNYCVYCNPPYSRSLGKWVEKAYKESLLSNKPIVLLIPARTDTKWFHNYILGKAAIHFIKGRLCFSGSKIPAPFPSMIVIYNIDHKTIDYKI